MDSTIFIAVISAAMLHAAWNAVVKGGRDKHLGMTAVEPHEINLAVVRQQLGEMPSDHL